MPINSISTPVANPTTPATVTQPSAPGTPAIPKAIMDAVEANGPGKQGAISPKGSFGAKVTKPEFTAIQKAINSAYGTSGPVPREVVDYLRVKLQPAEKAASVRTVFEAFMTRLEGRIAPDSPTNPNLPVDPPVVVEPPKTKVGFGYKVDFAKIGNPKIKCYADLFGAELENGKISPFAALGGPNAIPGATMAEKEAWVEAHVVPVDRRSDAPAEQPFAKVKNGISELPYVGTIGTAVTSMPSPNFMQGIGFYSADKDDNKIQCDPATLIKAHEQGDLGKYLMPRQASLMSHHSSGPHRFRAHFQQGMAIQNSAESTYMDCGRFDEHHFNGQLPSQPVTTKGDYNTLAFFDLEPWSITVGEKRCELTSKQMAAYSVAMGAVDHLVSKVSDISDFDLKYEGGQGLRSYHDMLTFAGLAYLAVVAGDANATQELATNRKWRNFCAEAGEAASNFGMWAPPVPGGITRALQEVKQTYGDKIGPTGDLTAAAKDIYGKFWSSLNSGKLAANRNPATEKFRYHQLTDAEVKPLDEALGVKAEEMPNDGLVIPKLTVAGYVEMVITRALPMDYTAPLEERVLTAKARAILAGAFLPEVMRRAGFQPVGKPEPTPEMEAAKAEFMATVGKIQQGMMQATAEEAFMALDPLLDKLDDIVLSVPKLLPPGSAFPEQSLALPPGALMWVTNTMDRGNHRNQSVLRPKLAFLGVDQDICVAA